jgi:hypothetical protein
MELATNALKILHQLMEIARTRCVNLDKKFLKTVAAKIVKIIHDSTMMAVSVQPMNVHHHRSCLLLDYVKTALQDIGSQVIRKVAYKINAARAPS